MPTPDPWALQAPEYFNFATDVIDRWARSRPEAKALWWVSAGDGNEKVFTFPELARLSRQAAGLFRASGCGAGTVCW